MTTSATTHAAMLISWAKTKGWKARISRQSPELPLIDVKIYKPRDVSRTDGVLTYWCALARCAPTKVPFTPADKESVHQLCAISDDFDMDVALNELHRFFSGVRIVFTE